jgi:hypothetical protein
LAVVGAGVLPAEPEADRSGCPKGLHD